MPTCEKHSQLSEDYFFLLLASVKHLGGLDAHLQNKRGEDLFVFPMEILRGLVPMSCVNWIGWPSC